MLRKGLFLLAILNLFSQQGVLAGGDLTWREKLIGSTFKSLARTFAAVNDIEKIKAKNITRVKKMDEEKFNKQRDKVYTVLKNLPPDFKSAYGISEDMSKEEILVQMASLDKQKINQIIGAIPDYFIAGVFNQYMEKTRQRIIQSNVVMQIKENWNKMVKGAQAN